MPIVSKALRGALWLFAENWASAILGLFSSIILARLLGPDAFGTVALAGIVLGAASLFIGHSLTDVLKQRETIEQTHIDTIFWLNTALSGTFALIIAACAGLIGDFFDSDRVTQIMPLMALVAFISSLMAIPSALLERDLEYEKLVRIDALAALPAVGGSIGLALAGWGVWSLVIGPFIGTLIGGLAAWHYAHYRPSFQISYAALRALMAFNRDTIILRLLDFADTGLPRLIVGLVGGERAVGLLDLAIKIAGQLSSLLMGPFAEMAMPVTARLQSDRAEIARILDAIYQLTTHLIYPAAIGLCVITPLVIPLVYGDAWQGAVIATQILLLATLRDATGSFNLAILRGVGEGRGPILVLCLGILTLVALAPLLAPYGVGGIAGLIALRVWLTWPISAKLVERAIGYPAIRQLTAGRQALACAALMGTIVFTTARFLPDDWPIGASLGFLILLGLLIYGALIAGLNRSKGHSLIETARNLRAQLGQTGQANPSGT